MTIRFQCGSCSQPIEIDDEWASKPVACPYCRKTVTAPIESTLGDPATIQTAVPVATQAAVGSEGPAIPQGIPVVRSRKNTLAIVALVLSILSTSLFVATFGVAAAHSKEVEQLQSAMAEAPTFAEQSKIMSEMLEANPEALPWLVMMTILPLGWMAANLAAVICAIIAVRRPVRRGLAVAALALGFLPILFFFGTLGSG